MTKWGLVATAALCVTLALVAACGGGGDDDDDNDDGTSTATRASGTRTGTAGAGTGTPGADGTQAPGGTPGTGSTSAAGTPAPGTTAAAQATTGAAPDSTPQPGTSPSASDDPLLGGAPTPNDAERLLAGEDSDPEQTGGNLDDDPRVVTDLPDPPDNASIDPATIADPNVSTGGVELIIDTNASEPGIQTTRAINVGDIVSVGVVVTNVPPSGLRTFNFELLYDIGTIVAPTINGGSTLARNPDANEAGIGTSSGWSCSPPAPEGDTDEPGLAGGDGDPTTGRAFMSCFATGAPTESGTIVVATVRFQAVAGGTSPLSLTNAAVSAGEFVGFGNCEVTDPVVPCRTATISVN